MASAQYDQSRNGWRIQLYTHTGRRLMLWLGDLKESKAIKIATMLEEIKKARMLGTEIEGDAKKWIGMIGPRIRRQLEEYDLIKPIAATRIPTKLRAFLDHYFVENSQLAPQTITNRKNSANHLCTFFGESLEIQRITAGDADRFARHQYATFLDASAGTTCSHAKSFFKLAVRYGAITSNPFEDVRVAKTSDQSRREYIDAMTIEKVIEKAPNQLWRTIIVLARYAGLAVPSEILSLRWSLVDWEGQKFTVTKPKNIHHANHVRVVPLFPRVRTELEKLFEEAPEKEDLVCPRYRTGKASPFRDGLIKICADASIPPWPKLWMNLRASARTDLEHLYPSYLCDAWLGHSSKIAKKHYLMATDSDYRAAAKGEPIVPPPT